MTGHDFGPISWQKRALTVVLGFESEVSGLKVGSLACVSISDLLLGLAQLMLLMLFLQLGKHKLSNLGHTKFHKSCTRWWLSVFAQHCAMLKIPCPRPRVALQGRSHGDAHEHTHTQAAPVRSRHARCDAALAKLHSISELISFLMCKVLTLDPDAC